MTLRSDIEQKFVELQLHRDFQHGMYEKGDLLNYSISDFESGEKKEIELEVIKFVGGGFAGQVYKVKAKNISSPVKGIEVDQSYAIKVLIPPSKLSQIFRDFLYRVGFQGSFQLQVNPHAARSGALWQKFIRRGAKAFLEREGAVVDILGTFIDYKLGSCGEISQWLEGRTWKLEIDDHLDYLSLWHKRRRVDEDKLGSFEYREKYRFMHSFVFLLHTMGAHEFARQYEWSTCKSQPNCLKENSSNELVAVDFRAGLTLLPFLPMSPGDFKLILAGIFKRGSFVQFDRGSLEALKYFMAKYHEDFSDMNSLFEELEREEKIYRNSVFDITHNLFIPLYSGEFWKIYLKSSITKWEIKGIIDTKISESLQKSRFKTLLFWFIGLSPFIGKFFQKFIGNKLCKVHYIKLLTNPKYLFRNLYGLRLQNIYKWYKSERITEEKARKLQNSFIKYLPLLLLSFLPIGLFKTITSFSYLISKLKFLIVRPIKLYLDPELREQWMLDMVKEGRERNLITDEDVLMIKSQIKEPFIQKYLKSLAVHVCTLPVTQVVSVLLATLFVLLHPEMPRAEAWGIGVGIIALFQVTPVSPGSLTRGLYVLYLVIKERNFKDYNIAVFLGFFKYVGYLAFPIQMTSKYPVIARFMASVWATDAVHVIPVFGESGALLEHKIFSLFYNWPLTIKRRMKEIIVLRDHFAPRFWHIVPLSINSAIIIWTYDTVWIKSTAVLPQINQMWWPIILLATVGGYLFSMYSAGATFKNRLIFSIYYGILTIVISFIGVIAFSGEFIDGMISTLSFRIFLYVLFAVIGGLLRELHDCSTRDA